MTINIDTIIEELTKLTCAIGDDGRLRRWFEGLAKKSVWDRRNAIYALCQKIAAEGRNSDVVASLKLLAIPMVFDAAREALQH